MSYQDAGVAVVTIASLAYRLPVVIQFVERHWFKDEPVPSKDA